MAGSEGATPGASRKLKILMLHGYTQTGHVFEIKTKALKKSLEKHFPPAPKPGYLQQYPGGVELVYPTGPIKLDYTEIPGFDETNGDKDAVDAYGWWVRRGDAEPYTYAGLERGLACIADALRQHGPFDAALGFSQGAAAAGMLASLLEPGRAEAFARAEARGGMAFPDGFAPTAAGAAVHPPLRFAVAYSGFGASTNALYCGFYEPKIRTPMLHFLGSLDTVVTEERSLRLVDACVDGRGKAGAVPRVVYHPGGHFLPSSQKQYVAALVAFIREVLGEGPDAPNGKQEESVEDMDVPF